jgi:hypothetical protein
VLQTVQRTSFVVATREKAARGRKSRDGTVPAGARTMIFKIIAFLAAAIPIFLFVRSIFFRRTTRINEGLREFKKQANLAVSIFLFLIVCVVVFAAGKLAWTWWSSL